VAIEAALAAGQILKAGLGRARKVRHKGFRDLVTELDLAAQAEIVGRIEAAFPDHRIMAEEDEAGPPELSGPVWIVDPLDGTTNFVHGLPTYCVSICLNVDGQAQVGVIYDPERDEIFSARQGEGAFLGDQPIRASAQDELSQSLLVTGFPYDLESQIEVIMARFQRLLTLSQGVRRLGSAALDLAYVACGRMDAFWEDGLHPWDMAAGVLLVAEAGGRVSDLDGQPFDLLSGRILASNNLIHQSTIAALRE